MKKLILAFILIVCILMCCSCTVVSPEQVRTTRYVVYDNYYSHPWVTLPSYHRPMPHKRPTGNYRPHKPVNKPSNHRPQPKLHNNNRR